MRSSGCTTPAKYVAKNEAATYLYDNKLQSYFKFILRMLYCSIKIRLQSGISQGLVISSLINLINRINAYQQLMISPYQQRQFQYLRKVIYDKYSKFLVDDQELILKQIEVMEECRERMQRKKAYQSFNNISLNITNISSIQNFSSTDESSFRNKFTEQFQNSILNAAIKQIKSNCSEQTFDTVMGYVLNNKIKQFEEIKKELQKRNKQYQELSALVIIKQKDINFLQRDLANLRFKEEILQEEKRKLKKKADMLDQKENRLHSAEMSLIFKEKLNLQGKRRYERQKEINQSFLKELEKIYKQIDSLWNNIIEQMQKNQYKCDKNCWKNEVMKKCKEQLVQQRRILQQQEKQIESQYETLRCLSEQVKKVFIGLNQQSIKKADENTKK